ncbi:MAG: hypothetical protein QM523_11380, partial [Candidatus Pacebacteria bacterium]|nr:hypothetical protein [Candidatus Paceibacterota bacterium]
GWQSSGEFEGHKPLNYNDFIVLGLMPDLDCHSALLSQLEGNDDFGLELLEFLRKQCINNLGFFITYFMFKS